MRSGRWNASRRNWSRPGRRSSPRSTPRAGSRTTAAGSPVSWLRWQTRVTGAAASAAAGWMRDLAAHPAIAAALAAGDLSVSWARQVCGWTDRLPEDARGGADRILLDAAAAGARLSDLGGLAEQLYRLTAGPDTDGADDGFNDRRVRLLTHFRGAGKLDGDLTPECAASLGAVLDSMSAKTGPEDVRTPPNGSTTPSPRCATASSLAACPTGLASPPRFICT